MRIAVDEAGVAPAHRDRLWGHLETVNWLVRNMIGYVVFAIYQATAPPSRKLNLAWRAAAWIPPWLIGLGIISYLGQFPSTKPSSGWPFSISLLAKQTIPFWWDLVIIAVFSLVIA